MIKILLLVVALGLMMTASVMAIGQMEKVQRTQLVFINSKPKRDKGNNRKRTKGRVV